MENPFKKSVTKEEEIVSDAETNENEENISEEVQAEEVKKEIADDDKFSELQEKYNQLNNQYIRLAADFDNFRKRTEQEREALLKYGAESTLKKMNVEVIKDKIWKIEDGYLRHDALKTAYLIFSYIMDNE